MKARHHTWFSSVASLSVLLTACAEEIKTIDATAVVVSVNSDLGAELVSAQATIFDEAGQNMGGTHSFALAGDGALALPFSFAVEPPGHATSGGFLVVVRGLDGAGNLLAETKARAAFLARKTRLLPLWLANTCRGVVCPSDQSCDYTDAGRVSSCGAIPSPKLEAFDEGADQDLSLFPTLASPLPPIQHMDDLDAGTDAGNGMPPIERAPNLPTVGSFRSVNEPRANSDHSLLLLDDGFEESGSVCNRDGWCAVTGFVP